MKPTKKKSVRMKKTVCYAAVSPVTGWLYSSLVNGRAVIFQDKLSLNTFMLNNYPKDLYIVVRVKIEEIK